MVTRGPELNRRLPIDSIEFLFNLERFCVVNPSAWILRYLFSVRRIRLSFLFIHVTVGLETPLFGLSKLVGALPNLSIAACHTNSSMKSNCSPLCWSWCKKRNSILNINNLDLHWYMVSFEIRYQLWMILQSVL